MLEDIGAMIRVSLEEIEAETTIVVEAGELESAVVDIIDAGTASERADGQIEDLLEVAQGLENLLDIATESLQAGGLTTTDAKLFKIAVESYSSRVEGLTFSPTPALEAFGGTASRYETTTVAMEGLVENLKAIWEHIKAAFKKAWEAIKSFVSAMSNGMKALETRAKALTAAVDKTKGKAEGKIAVNGGALAYEGKTDIKSIVKGLKATAVIVESVVTKGVIVCDNIYDQIEANLRDGSAVLDIEKAFKNERLKVGAISGGYTVSDLLEIAKDGAGSSTEIDVPALGDIKSLGLAALDIAKVLNDEWKTFSTMVNRAQEVERAIDRYVAKGVSEQRKETSDDASKSKGSDLKVILQAFRRNLAGKIAHVSNVGGKSAVAAVSLGEKSLRKYRA